MIILPKQVKKDFIRKIKIMLSYIALISFTLLWIKIMMPEERFIDSIDFPVQVSKSEVQLSLEKQYDVNLVQLGQNAEGIEIFISKQAYKISMEEGRMESRYIYYHDRKSINDLPETSEYQIIMVATGFIAFIFLLFLFDLFKALRNFERPPKTLPSEKNIFHFLSLSLGIILIISSTYYSIYWPFITDIQSIENLFSLFSALPLIVISALIITSITLQLSLSDNEPTTSWKNHQTRVARNGFIKGLHDKKFNEEFVVLFMLNLAEIHNKSLNDETEPNNNVLNCRYNTAESIITEINNIRKAGRLLDKEESLIIHMDRDALAELCQLAIAIRQNSDT